MKKITAFIFLFSVAVLSARAQKKLYLSQNPKWIEWAENPSVHAIPPEYATQPAYIILNDVSIEYRREGKSTQTYYTAHQIIKVLDNRGVESFSTLDIDLPLRSRVPTVKVRVISPTGKVQEITREKIITLLGEDGHYTISIPMEGLQRNSEIEYLVKEIHSGHAFAKQYFQHSIPVAQTRFLLTYRKDMVMETKSYNGFPDLKPELKNNRYELRAQVADIPALLEEDNSFYNLHRMSLDYRLSYWTTINSEKIKYNTFDTLARHLFNENYKVTNNDRKAVNNFLSELGVLANGNEAENIRKIEEGIKKKITLYPFVNYDLRKQIIAQYEGRSMSVYSASYDDPKDVLDTILTKRATNYMGYIKLFAACLTQANVKHQLGLAWDRTERAFDPSFESWVGLEEPLFYFPNQKKFLSPTSIYLRYPVIPTTLANSKGVFCAIPQKGDLTGQLYKVRRITPLPASETKLDITASVSFSKEMDAKTDISYEWYGYEAIDVRSSLPFVRAEDMKKYVAQLTEFTDNQYDILSYSFTNEDPANYYKNKPLTLYVSADASSLIDKSANKYLVKVGALIGEHSNLYDNKPRVMPVDLLYPQSYNRTITINIPKGYKILNPEAARMSADYLNGDLDNVINFSSDYRLVKDNKNGDKLVITINEHYSQLHFSLIEYGRIRSVLNTAADFNKVTLVMARK